MPNEWISIIISSYNYETFIAETIDSVLAQTHQYWELIIIDDGSNDNSIEVIQGYVERDNRIRLLQHPDKKNHGLAQTLQLGIANVIHPVVVFLESDDLLFPESLEKRLATLHDSGADLVFNKCFALHDGAPSHSNIAEYLERIDNLMISRKAPFSLLNDYYGNCNFIPTFSCVMVRRECLLTLDFSTPYDAWLDFWLWAQLSLTSLFAYHSKPLTKWRIHSKSYNAQHYSTADNTFFIAFHRAVRKKLWTMALKRMNFTLLYKLFLNFLILHCAKPVVRLKNLTKSIARIILSKLRACVFCLYLKIKKIKICFMLATSLYTKKNRTLFLHYLKMYLTEISFNKPPKPEVSTQKDIKIHFQEETYNPIQQFLLSEFSNFFLKKNRSSKTPSLLFIFHELSLTGAPAVAVQLVLSLAKHYGTVPVVLSMRDGPLRSKLERAGIHVIIDNRTLTSASDSFLDALFCRHFDAIIVNSLASSMFLQHFDCHGLPAAWWIHETGEGFRYAPPVLPHCFNMMKAVWLGSPNSEPYIQNYISKTKVEHLLYGVEDCVTENRTVSNSPLISFGVIGSIIPRKGHAVFLNALEQLSPAVQQNIRFVLIGDPYEPDMWPDYTASIFSKIQKHPNIEYYHTMAQEEYLAFLSSLDVLICPSTDDPMPVVVTEALMLSKLCIISDAIGQAKLLTEEEAILVPSGSATALAEAITKIASQPEVIANFAQPARAAYERFFAMKQFEANAIRLVETLLGSKKS